MEDVWLMTLCTLKEHKASVSKYVSDQSDGLFI